MRLATLNASPATAMTMVSMLITNVRV